MRDINCPNLTRLIGLCPEKNNVCIITEYCSRGKLQVSQLSYYKFIQDFLRGNIEKLSTLLKYLKETPDNFP